MLPILGLATPAIQHLWVEYADTLVEGRCATAELNLLDRFNRQQLLINAQLAEHDSHSSDDEVTTRLKLSANAQAAKATRGTELARIGSKKRAS